MTMPNPLEIVEHAICCERDCRDLLQFSHKSVNEVSHWRWLKGLVHSPHSSSSYRCWMGLRSDLCRPVKLFHIKLITPFLYGFHFTSLGSPEGVTHWIWGVKNDWQDRAAKFFLTFLKCFCFLTSPCLYKLLKCNLRREHHWLSLWRGVTSRYDLTMKSLKLIKLGTISLKCHCMLVVLTFPLKEEFNILFEFLLKVRWEDW